MTSVSAVLNGGLVGDVPPTVGDVPPTVGDVPPTVGDVPHQ